MSDRIIMIIIVIVMIIMIIVMIMIILARDVQAQTFEWVETIAGSTPRLPHIPHWLIMKFGENLVQVWRKSAGVPSVAAAKRKHTTCHGQVQPGPHREVHQALRGGRALLLPPPAQLGAHEGLQPGSPGLLLWLMMSDT